MRLPLVAWGALPLFLAFSSTLPSSAQCRVASPAAQARIGSGAGLGSFTVRVRTLIGDLGSTAGQPPLLALWSRYRTSDAKGIVFGLKGMTPVLGYSLSGRDFFIINASTLREIDRGRYVALTVTFDAGLGRVKFYADGKLLSAHTVPNSHRQIFNSPAPARIGCVASDRRVSDWEYPFPILWARVKASHDSASQVRKFDQQYLMTVDFWSNPPRNVAGQLSTQQWIDALSRIGHSIASIIILPSRQQKSALEEIHALATLKQQLGSLISEINVAQVGWNRIEPATVENGAALAREAAKMLLEGKVGSRIVLDDFFSAKSGRPSHLNFEQLGEICRAIRSVDPDRVLQVSATVYCGSILPLQTRQLDLIRRVLSSEQNLLLNAETTQVDALALYLNGLRTSHAVAAAYPELKTCITGAEILLYPNILTATDPAGLANNCVTKLQTLPSLTSMRIGSYLTNLAGTLSPNASGGSTGQLPLRMTIDQKFQTLQIIRSLNIPIQDSNKRYGYGFFTIPTDSNLPIQWPELELSEEREQLQSIRENILPLALTSYEQFRK